MVSETTDTEIKNKSSQIYVNIGGVGVQCDIIIRAEVGIDFRVAGGRRHVVVRGSRWLFEWQRKQLALIGCQNCLVPE